MKNKKFGVFRNSVRTELIVPHQDDKITFAYPPYGPDCLSNNIKRMREDGLREPTSRELLSLIEYAIGNSAEVEFSEITKQILGRKHLQICPMVLTQNGAFLNVDPPYDEQIAIDEFEFLDKLKGSEEPSFVKDVPSGFVEFRDFLKSDFARALEQNFGDKLLKLEKILLGLKSIHIEGKFKSENSRLATLAISTINGYLKITTEYYEEQLEEGQNVNKVEVLCSRLSNSRFEGFTYGVI